MMIFRLPCHLRAHEMRTGDPQDCHAVFIMASGKEARPRHEDGVTRKGMDSRIPRG